jgi:hypothetical protein
MLLGGGRLAANVLANAAFALSLTACATVRPEDLASWRGRPVAELDKHPIFATMRMTRSIAADGTEVRNYSNAVGQTTCGGEYAISCVSKTPACNNVFHIKDGIVQRYTPIGSGGGRCFTDERARPDFTGATNY